MMAKYKIEVDDNVCVGCGACAATCDEGFVLKDTDKGSRARPKKAEVDELGCIKDAADVCPVGAIKIIEIKKKE